MESNLGYADKHSKILEDYERLKAKITMFLTEVNGLTSYDTDFLIEFNNLRVKHLGNIEIY